jgi:hypothetical protein
MDRLVYATRIDRLLFRKVQPRTFRWSPLLVIAALIAGYVMMAQMKGLPDRTFFVGWLLFYGAFLVAAFLRLFGPRFTGPVDERELMVKSRAYAISGIVLASFAMLGCFYMPSAGVLRLWQPHAPLDWINLGFGFQAAGNLLPTWIASWLEPRPIAEHED